MAKELTYQASLKVADKKSSCPFQKKFKSHENKIWTGGKEDDITAIAVYAV